MGFLRNLFGPSQEEVWQQLAAEIGAKFVDGGMWHGDKVQAQVKQWTVTIDTFTVSTGKTHMTFTRLRAPYVNADGFRFKIFRKSFFSGMGKALGMQDVEIGEPQFDDDFIIQGNEAEKLKQFFAHPQIRQILSGQPEVNFEVKDDEGWFATNFPEGVDEVVFYAPGLITDVARLKELYSLFALVLDHLCQIGSAYEHDPQVSL